MWAWLKKQRHQLWAAHGDTVFAVLLYRRVQCEKRDKLLAASTLCYLVGAFNGSLFVRALEYVAIGNYGGLALVHRAFSGTRQSKFVANLLLYLAFMVIFIRFFFTNAEFLIDYHFFF